MSGSLHNCRRKVRIDNAFAAVLAAWRMQFKNPYAKISAYTCKFCDGWHIGNSFNRQDARKTLNRIVRMMSHPNYYTKTPAEVQQYLAGKREKMEGFLATRKGGENDGEITARYPFEISYAPRWQRRRMSAPPIRHVGNKEFRGTAILSA